MRKKAATAAQQQQESLCLFHQILEQLDQQVIHDLFEKCDHAKIEQLARKLDSILANKEDIEEAIPALLILLNSEVKDYLNALQAA